MPIHSRKTMKKEAASLSKLPPLHGAAHHVEAGALLGQVGRSRESVHEMSTPELRMRHASMIANQGSDGNVGNAPRVSGVMKSMVSSAFSRVMPTKRSQSLVHLAPLKGMPLGFNNPSPVPMGKAGSTPRHSRELRPSCPWEKSAASASSPKLGIQELPVVGHDLRPACPWSDKMASTNLSDRPSPVQLHELPVPVAETQAVATPSSQGSHNTAPPISVRTAGPEPEMLLPVDAQDSSAKSVAVAEPVSPMKQVGMVGSLTVWSGKEESADAAGSPCSLRPAPIVLPSPAGPAVAKSPLGESTGLCSGQGASSTTPSSISQEQSVSPKQPPAIVVVAKAKDALKRQLNEAFFSQRDLGLSPTSATIRALHLCTALMQSSTSPRKQPEEAGGNSQRCSFNPPAELLSPKSGAVATC